MSHNHRWMNLGALNHLDRFHLGFKKLSCFPSHGSPYENSGGDQNEFNKVKEVGKKVD